MTFNVCLGKHVEAIAVAEIVEEWIVGIVGSAYGVDVQTLHGAYVLFHLLAGYGSSIDRTEIVAIDTVKHHSLAIDEEGAIAAANAYFAETNLTATNVYGIARSVLENYDEVIKIRLLGAPLARISNVHTEAYFRTCRCCG